MIWKSRHNHVIYKIAECVGETHQKRVSFHYVLVYNKTNFNVILKWFFLLLWVGISKLGMQDTARKQNYV